MLGAPIADQVLEILVDAHATDERLQMREFGWRPTCLRNGVIFSRKA
jgi:hypothetical protein